MTFEFVLGIVVAYTVGILVGIFIAHKPKIDVDLVVRNVMNKLYDINRFKREDETYAEWQERIKEL